MSESAYQIVKSFYSSIYKKEDESKINIDDFPTFSDYVKSVYYSLEIRASYFSDTALFMNISENQVNQLILEVIFLNLYEQLTLIEQILKGKGEKHESFLCSLDLQGDELTRYHERFRKQMQAERLHPKSLRSFKKFHTIKVKGLDEFLNERYFVTKFYVPYFIKIYKDVIFVQRTGTNILDISPYYREVFKALMYETESEHSDREFREPLKIDSQS